MPGIKQAPIQTDYHMGDAWTQFISNNICVQNGRLSEKFSGNVI